ncbi:MAG TPA: hypothetical protein PLY93_14330, partial [Turneriella sp.]|nr:hypothetical protein [Turneriella sp.]
MKLYINSLYLLFLFMGFSFLQAETIITTQGIVKGKIIDAQTEFVAVQEDASMPRVIPRVEILRIFDDTQTLVWQNPTIVHEDKTTVKPQEETPWRRNFDIGVKGGLHLLWPNGTLSAMPLGISPGYQLAFDGAAVAAWYFADDAALTAGLGYARRPVALQGILEGGQVHKGVWSIDDGILQLGYRMHSGIFFLEGGLDLAFPLANAALQLTPSATSVKTPYTTPFSLSFYIAVGA